MAATIIAASIAALVATLGYYLTARSKILEEKRKVYAAALAAVTAYKRLPHRIRRRADESSKTRGEIGIVISEVQRDLDYYACLLGLEAPWVARAYNALIIRVRIYGADQRKHAWAQSAAASDADFSYDEQYHIDDSDEIDYCQQLMRHELRLVPLGRFNLRPISKMQSSTLRSRVERQDNGQAG